ncbi:MAG: glycerate kinase [Clostridiales bacterium]|jgi:glycerate kinase|nr:glycerate kinase [Clostridiales bacterium]HOB63738.1 glycerate kinase [Clostridia bacterium]HOK82516.1 glycerate kinase [Clostridia bacterium]HOL61649.1 glycerate kinase [Clostridia bacterium]HPO54279.1 glycerate kinase [Clostridia bacterium]
MKVVIAPDSFKGTLTAAEVASLIAKALKENYPETETDEAPVADGGEGTLDCIYKAIGGQLISKRVRGPYQKKVTARLLITPGGSAVVELAEAAGLAIVKDNKNPMLTTTYGVGELIKEALDRGAGEVILALGGSSTNDGGIGMAVALGLKAYDKDGNEFLPTGGTLSEIWRLDFRGLDTRISKTRFLALCDVTTGLCGKEGAAYIFAPQKGATAEMLPLLDKGLFDLNKRIEEATGKSYLELEGGGAAGGAGAGAAAFLSAKMVRGIETILDLINFDARIKDADYVITGEGRADNQSFMGKVLSGVANRVSETNAKLILLVGSCVADEETLKRYGVTAVYQTGTKGNTLSEIKKKAPADLYFAAKKIVL